MASSKLANGSGKRTNCILKTKDAKLEGIWKSPNASKKLEDILPTSFNT